MTISSLEDLEVLVETVDVECKAAQGKDGAGELPDSLWETYSAMANTAGGEVFLGIEETKEQRFICLGIKKISTPTPTGAEASAGPPIETPMTEEMSVENSYRVLEALRRNPLATLVEVSREIGKSLRTVERLSSKLVDEGKLRRIGPKKGGRWEVVET